MREIRCDTNGAVWADFPQVGFNKDWIVVQANMRNLASVAGNSDYNRSHIYMFDKAAFYSVTNYRSPTLRMLTNEPGSFTYLGESPALTYDNTSTNLWLVQNANGNSGGSGCLRIFRVTGTATNPILDEAYVTNALYAQKTNITWSDVPPSRNFAPQLGSSAKIDVDVDSRIQNVVYRNGYLWCTHTVFLPATNPVHCVVQWWQINPETREIRRFGRIDESPPKFYAFPSIAVNRFDDALIGYASFATNQYAAASYSFRAFHDMYVGNGMTQFRGEYTFKPSTNSYEVSSWGDYSMTVVDPLNDADFWTIQTYAANTVEWGTWWAQVKVDVPANDHFTNATVLAECVGTTNATLNRATRETGETNHAGNANSPSVWYNWTAPGNAFVRFTTTNTFVDTIIAVYAGTAVEALTEVTNRHATGGTNLFFTAVSNTTYRVAVAGYNGASGDFTLLWFQTNAPMIAAEPRDWNVYQGSNVTLAVTVCADPAAAYQWRRHNDTNLVIATNIVGATSANLTLSDVSTNDTGYYSVVATNIYGTNVSRIAHLQVYSTQRAMIGNAVHLTNIFKQVVSGITGAAYAVEASSNLVNWVPIETNTVTFTNLDNTITNYASRFYRVSLQ